MLVYQNDFKWLKTGNTKNMFLIIDNKETTNKLILLPISIYNSTFPSVLKLSLELYK